MSAAHGTSRSGSVAFAAAVPPPAGGGWLRERRYALLFFSLLASLVLVPLVGPAGLRGEAVEVLLAVNLIAALTAIGSRTLRRISMLLLMLALAARPGAAWLDQAGLSASSLLVWAALALVAAASALRFAVRGDAVGREQIFAALSTYLLAGLSFGLLYWALNFLVPGTLSVGGAPAGAALPVNVTIYFSFVTLASLGYGDVLPVSDVARGLAVIEVVGGQLYLAVLVARLVGLRRS